MAMKYKQWKKLAKKYNNEQTAVMEKNIPEILDEHDGHELVLRRTNSGSIRYSLKCETCHQHITSQLCSAHAFVLSHAPEVTYKGMNIQMSMAQQNLLKSWAKKARQYQ